MYVRLGRLRLLEPTLANDLLGDFYWCCKRSVFLGQIHTYEKLSPAVFNEFDKERLSCFGYKLVFASIIVIEVILDFLVVV